MTKKGGKEYDARLRIDPVLVDKFRRLQGGINEVGTKIVQDLGLRYQFDKVRGTLDLIGPDTEILGLAVETLRFWVEDDDFPDTGITCQVGYPNRSTVIWRFHGDFAKKFDHLFADDISKLKLIPSVNIKAVPTKRNPEYVELYCHFSVYNQVKGDIRRISKDLGRIHQDDFFIPKSDSLKARDFARSKIDDKKVLYALKEYPDNKMRVWIFARDHIDVIRARKEWVLHVGILARENVFTETVTKANSIRSASFYGHPASEIASEISGPTHYDNSIMTKQDHQQSNVKPMVQTTFNLSTARSRITSKSKASNKSISSRQTSADNPNFPRPPDFVYPIQRDPTRDDNTSTISGDGDEEVVTNPFVANAELADGFNTSETLNTTNEMIGGAKWIKDEETNLYPTKHYGHPIPYRAYLHHEVGGPQIQNQQQSKMGNFNGTEQLGKLVVHPEKNLAENERYKPTPHKKSVLTSVTDPRQAPAIRKGNKGVRPGEKTTAKKAKVNASTRQKRPVLKAKKPPSNIRYNINVNGLDIYMYKQNISKLTNMDALVNVVSSNLKEGDKIATDIFEEGGKKIKDELDIHLRLYGEVKMGENVVTSAGRLPALGLIHVVSPVWGKYTVWEDCATDLHKALYDTLKTAETHKYRRIAIPTIGSEPYFGIPKDLVAEVYVKALIDYSMGMGPMYPVLEIHLVDSDPNMLTYIKDAYESWASTPGVTDMTHHITKIENDPMINDVNEMSKRSQSAVSLGSMPTHRSENMVTFTGQSYTKDGEQKWTFDVLKKLVVHVYTGSVLKLDNSVEAIVCAVDINMKGSLAKQIQSLGGKTYKTSLKNARGNRTLAEGDVLISDAGDLGMRKIIHSVIASPIHHINQNNISRLDNINTQVFYEAHQQRIRVLAMPLIGTGRLRERLEIEQCSLQLIDNIIELCLTLGKTMKLRELHLVNTNHVMTQYLTQALRTRAHTKLRVENEPNAPSRQDVLTKSGRVRQNPDRLSARSVRSKASSNKSFSSKNINRENDHNKEDLKGVQNVETSRKTNELGNVPDAKTVEIVVDNADQDKAERKKDPVKQSESTTKDIRGAFEYISDSKKNTSYLSKNNLEKHNRIVHDGKRKKHTTHDMKSKELEVHHELTPLDKDLLLKKAKALLTDRKPDHTKKQHRKKHRIIQRSSDFIFLKSKADSYKTIYEKKQKYAELSHREDQLNLRKTQSSDDIWKTKVADEVFQTFKEEREKLSKQKQVSAGESMLNTNTIKENTDVKEKKKYFTRKTSERYKSKPQIDDVNERFEKINRIDVNEENHRSDMNERRNQANRSEDQNAGQKSNKRRRERYLNDIEREDQYMMDMDFLAKEYEEKLDGKKVENTDEAVGSEGENLQDPLPIVNKDGSSETNYQLSSTPNSQSKLLHITHRSSQNEEVNMTQQSSNLKNPRQNFNHQDMENNMKLDDEFPISDDENALVQVNATSNQLTGRHNVKSNSERFMSHESTPRKTSKKNTRVSFVHNYRQKIKQSVGKAQFIQSYNNTPRPVNEISNMTKTIEWKNSRKVDKELLERFNEQQRAKRAPRADEVTIRDKLKLQINVVDRKLDDSEHIEKEKRKIKRFWHAVDGDELRNEKEMFGDVDEKDKMLVAKVTKERKMSAKSRNSRQSRGSVVTHDVGNFNVTLEVAN